MDRMTVGGLPLDSMAVAISDPRGLGRVDTNRPIPEQPDTGEPPIGAVVVEGEHVWLRRSDGYWSGCVTCDDEDRAWSWEEVRADIGGAPWRVVEP